MQLVRARRWIRCPSLGHGSTRSQDVRGIAVTLSFSFAVGGAITSCLSSW